MATFEQVFYNVLGGVFIVFVSFWAFGFALRKGYNNQLAPRTWSRPKDVLKNAIKAPYWYGWLRWAYSVNYPDLMQGIPGTGTRQDGWSGPLLKCDLDGIVMLKFHVLQMKVAAFATVLCLFIILPLNITATCDVEEFGPGTCDPLLNLSDFDRATIVHIPPLRYNNATGNEQDATTAPSANTTSVSIVDALDNTFWVPSANFRYAAIVVCFLAICYYTCHLLYQEWISNLALRRIFYLEIDHYGERLKELNEVMNLDVPEDPFQKERHPWLPHPELRETLPNVSLFSVLYRMPHGLKRSSSKSTRVGTLKTDLEEQLAATVEFFDECVPNQPGFSSSVVAATILPRADHTALVWKKWYRLGSKNRLLRYLRMHIQKRLEKGEDNGEEAMAPGETVPLKPGEVTPNDAPVKEPVEKEIVSDDTPEVAANAGTTQVELQFFSCRNGTEDDAERDSVGVQEKGDDTKKSADNEICFSTQQNKESQQVSVEEDRKPQQIDPSTDVSTSLQEEGGRASKDLNFKYSNFDVENYAKSIGLSESVDIGSLLTDMGIEQLGVFAREYSQSASNGCPFGWGREISINFYTLEKLRAMEEETLAHIKDLTEELLAARESVNELSYGFSAASKKKNGMGENLVELCEKPDGGSEQENENIDVEEGIIASATESSSLLRQRATTTQHWENAIHLASSMQWSPSEDLDKKNNGYVPTLTRVKRATVTTLKKSKQSMKSILEHPTYAVITFTSRQAAIAARQCLTDGGGLNRWEPIGDIPAAPLADAPPRDLFFFRGCCRPVTLEISENEKKWRRFFAMVIYIFFCLGYSVPLAAVSELLNPETLAEWFPDSKALQDPDNFFFKFLSGISSGMLYTLFFSFCPQLFKAIANFEGKVTSRRTMEDKAIRFFWYFMLLTAFTGTFLTSMMFNFFSEGNFGDQIDELLRDTAASIPTQQAPVWLNWLVVRLAWTWPALYLFQFNTFGLSIIQWPWMSRVMRGGGPGGPAPYRIYIDAATVTMIVTSIAPVCPVVAPFAFAYYVMVIPIIRWLLVFVYRPYWFDGGGTKWPVLHEMVISGIVLGQILLSAMLSLRFAYFAGAIVLLSIIPTLIFNSYCKDRFLRPYEDAGLLQTSKLDGWDPSEPTSEEKREEYRRWLVDCHVANYVPICLVGSNTFMTAEPAVVVSTKHHDEATNRSNLGHKGKSQRLAFFRRAVGGDQDHAGTSIGKME